MSLTQFFINYWWLILLSILIISSIITKNFVKFVCIFVVFVIIYVLFWEFYISPSLSKSNQCLQKIKDDTISIAQKTSSMTDENEKTQTVCNEDNSNYTEFINCLSTSKSENEVSFTFFINTSAYKKIMAVIIDSHNQMCPGSPLTTPSF